MEHLKRRLISWWWDYVVVLSWLIVVFVLLGLPTLLGWVDLEPVWSRQITADLAVTLLTVVPYLVYLVLTERGPARATWGKRRSGLVVETADGSAGGTRRIVIRNVVKVLPWQLGHMAAMRFAAGAASFRPAAAFYSASLVLLVMVAGPAIVGRRGLHDTIAGTVVRPAPGVARTAPAPPK